MNGIIKKYVSRKCNCRKRSFPYPNSLHSAYLRIGEELGTILSMYIVSGDATIRLASSDEDADSLCKYVLNSLSGKNIEPLLSIFWHKTFRIGDIQFAPIVMKYEEKRDVATNIVVVVKSQINSMSEITSELIELFEKGMPRKTLIVMPEENNYLIPSLINEFPKEYSSTFEFFFINGVCTIYNPCPKTMKDSTIYQKERTYCKFPKLIAKRTALKPKADYVDYCVINSVLHNVNQPQNKNQANVNSKD